MSGLIADSRTMVDKARVDGQNHWFVYNEPMTVESVAQSVSNLAMKFGKYDRETPMVRKTEIVVNTYYQFMGVLLYSLFFVEVMHSVMIKRCSCFRDNFAPLSTYMYLRP